MVEEKNQMLQSNMIVLMTGVEVMEYDYKWYEYKWVPYMSTYVYSR